MFIKVYKKLQKIFDKLNVTNSYKVIFSILQDQEYLRYYKLFPDIHKEIDIKNIQIGGNIDDVVVKYEDVDFIKINKRSKFNKFCRKTIYKNIIIKKLFLPKYIIWKNFPNLCTWHNSIKQEFSN